MKRIYIIISLFLLAANLHAQQSVEEILALIELNNTTLQAAADRIEVSKQEVMLETALDDPEIGFDYLWGKPGIIGHRKDVNINQSFDLSTLLGYRKRLAQSQQELLDLDLYQQHAELELQALDFLAQLTYYNQAIRLYDERLAQAEKLVSAYERRLAEGEANKLELNKVRLDKADVEADREQSRTERDLLLLELQRMCGGVEIAFDATDYLELEGKMSMSVRDVREAQGLQQQAVAEADLQATRAQSLPSITAGYMAELTEDEKWRGVTLSVSIPLWGNRKNVRRARLQQQSARSEASDITFQLEQATQSQRLRTERYHDIAFRLKQQLDAAGSEPLLRKALLEGEISLVDYTVQVSDLFALRLKCLEAERDYQQARLLLSGMLKNNDK